MKDQDFKRTVKFVDGNGNIVKVKIEITDSNKCKELSMSGECDGSMGQCDDSIDPATDSQKTLLDIWGKYHLNTMNAGTPEQKNALNKATLKNINVSDYGKACNYLKFIDLYTVQNEGKPYNYGSSWLIELLPTNTITIINAVCDGIELDNKNRTEALKKHYCTHCNELIYSEKVELSGTCPECGKFGFLKTIDTWTDVYNLEMGDIVIFDDDKIIALGKYLDITPGEALEDISNCPDIGENNYTYAGQDYLVCDDTEADEEAQNYLTDDPETWKMAVDAGDTTEGLETWAAEVLRYDGRGSLLNRYNGEEGEERVNEVDYYIYRS